MQRAIETKLKDSKKAQQIIYNLLVAHEKFSFIETTFVPTIETRSEKICLKELRKKSLRNYRSTFTSTSFNTKFNWRVFN